MAARQCRARWVAFALLAGACGFAGAVVRGAPAATQPAAAGDKAVAQRISNIEGQIRQALPWEDRADPARQRAQRERILPLLYEAKGLIDQQRMADPKGVNYFDEAELMPLLVMYGDAGAAAELDRRAGGGGADAAAARAEMLAARWFETRDDAAAQSKIMDELQMLAREHPIDESVANETMWMMRAVRGDPAKVARLRSIICDDLTGFSATLWAGEFKRQAAENLPFVLEGKTVDGHDFTTADWKGKVVVIDFWATWCVPCKEELPHIQKLYTQYHEKGLEVVSVACHDRDDNLKTYLKAHPEFSWTQVLDADRPDRPGVATQLQINGIPLVFIVDRKGVLRSALANGKLDVMIPKLLGEPID